MSNIHNEITNPQLKIKHSSLFRPALSSLAFFVFLTGVLYPLSVTGLAALFFPDEASGSLVVRDGRVIGSRLLGQEFSDARFFKARPSAVAYAASGGSATNLGPNDSRLIQAVEERRATWEGFTGSKDIPAEMLYASASGLDPDISLGAALAQIPSVALAWGIGGRGEENLRALVLSQAAKNSGPFEFERVNVLELNRAVLDLYNPQ